MDNEIQPIETLFRGYRFRSRTEARWAVAFDTLGWHWTYETEGYRGPAGLYLPDFAIETSDGEKCWWEIKPARRERSTRQLVDLRWVELVRGTDRALVVAFGLPAPGEARWDVWTLEAVRSGPTVSVPDLLRLTPTGYGGGDGELRERWASALTAARSARFEHHATDLTAQPRDHMQRAAGDR